MRRENQLGTMTFEFTPIDGIGTVPLKNGGFMDVNVYGIIRFDKWQFIVHRDVKQPKYFAVSEASSGMLLNKDNYYTIEDALYFAEEIIYKNRQKFSTSVGNYLAKTQRNLLKRNTSLLTPAIVSLWK